MIPLRDEIRSHRTPFVTYGLIALNVAVYLVQVSQGAHLEAFVFRYALIPSQLSADLSLANIADIFTSMFMHAGLLHLSSNMLYLWIFGDNVEDAMGHLGYLIFYLLGGVLAALTHWVTNMNSPVPTVGASGAIAAVLGAYVLLYPASRVMTLIPLGYFIRVTSLPAALVLGFWFILQFFEGILSLGADPLMGGVAVWAHIGGFVAGVVLVRLFAPRGGTSYTPFYGGGRMDEYPSWYGRRRGW